MKKLLLLFLIVMPIIAFGMDTRNNDNQGYLQIRHIVNRFKSIHSGALDNKAKETLENCLFGLYRDYTYPDQKFYRSYHVFDANQSASIYDQFISKACIIERIKNNSQLELYFPTISFLDVINTFQVFTAHEVDHDIKENNRSIETRLALKHTLSTIKLCTTAFCFTILLSCKILSS